MLSSRRRTTSAAVLAATLLALAGCSATSGTSDSTASSDTGVGSVGSAAGSAKAPIARRAALEGKAVIRTGEIAVTSRHPDRVRGKVDALLRSLGGTVDREDTTNARDGSIDSSTLVLRVPVDDFDTAKKSLGRLGRPKSSTESEKDVTTEVIDTSERVQTLQNSLDRLQRFQRSSTNVAALIRYEQQITDRQSELQSLAARQTYLRGQTSMSTITLYLSTPEKYVAPPGVLDDAGFLAGLTGGWHALVGVGVVALTVVGALLPFAVVLMVVGLPLWVGMRSLLRRRRAGATST